MQQEASFNYSAHDISQKEYEIITLVAQGLSNKEIAALALPQRRYHPQLSQRYSREAAAARPHPACRVLLSQHSATHPKEQIQHFSLILTMLRTFSYTIKNRKQQNISGSLGVHFSIYEKII